MTIETQRRVDALRAEAARVRDVAPRRARQLDGRADMLAAGMTARRAPIDPHVTTDALIDGQHERQRRRRNSASQGRVIA